MAGNVARLAIGTAQFGMAYGVANASGQLSVYAARSVLDVARASGIDTIDTAVAYGASQRTLGEIGVEGLRVVTKLPAFTGTEHDIPSWVSGTVAAALRELDVTSVYGLMFHHAGDLAGVHGQAFHREALKLRESGLVERLGVSVYGPDELEAVDKYALDLVQAPYNVVDQRVASSGWLDRLVDRGVEIHTRSVFLQGLLLMAAAERPKYFAPWAAEFGLWDRWCVEQGVDPLEAALGFVVGDSRIDRVLVGIDSPAQLQQIIAAARRAQVSPRFDGLAIDDPALVNPSSWKV